jgi:hypothetical protein
MVITVGVLLTILVLGGAVLGISALSATKDLLALVLFGLSLTSAFALRRLATERGGAA